jgi:hypothetical protein
MSKQKTTGVSFEAPSIRTSHISQSSKKPQTKNKLTLDESTFIGTELSNDSQSATPRYCFNTEIPERYNETYIIAIPKDPNWMYVYWEFSDETANLMESNLEQSGSKLVLRLKETEVAESLEVVIPFQVDVAEINNGQYMPIPENSKQFQIECGCFSENGDYIPIAQSDPVFIPSGDADGQIFDIFASDEEKMVSVFNSVNSLTNSLSNSMQSDFFNSKSCTSYSKPLPGSAGSIF